MNAKFLNTFTKCLVLVFVLFFAGNESFAKENETKIQKSLEIIQMEKNVSFDKISSNYNQVDDIVDCTVSGKVTIGAVSVSVSVSAANCTQAIDAYAYAVKKIIRAMT